MVDGPPLSGKAVASLVLGILSFLCNLLAGIPAIVLGVLALRDINRSDEQLRGRGLAIAGIVTASVGIVITFLVVIAGALLIPAVNLARSAAERTQCQNNFKLLGIAIHNYYDTVGRFPPAYIPDASGQPMHSWRTLILPYIEQAPLYHAYNFREPWNSPHNAALPYQKVPNFNCPADKQPASTGVSYVAVLGPGFMFDGNKSARINNIRDGASITIALTEVTNSGIGLTEPRDLTWEEFFARFRQHNLSNHPQGFHVLMADCFVHFMPYDTDEADLHGLFTINGREVIKWPITYDAPPKPPERKPKSKQKRRGTAP